LREFLQKILKNDHKKYLELQNRAANISIGQERWLEALEHSVAAENWNQAITLVEKLSEIYSRNSNMVLAKEAIEKLPKNKITYKLKSFLGMALMNTNNLEEAEKELLEVYENPQERWRCLPSLASLYEAKCIYEKAIALCDEALNQKDLYNSRQICSILSTKAKALQDINQVDDAVNLTRENLEIAKKSGDIATIAGSNHFASLIFKGNHDDEAIECCKKSIHLFDRINMKTRAAVPRRLLSIFLLNEGKTNEALELIKPTIDIAEKFQPINLIYFLRTKGDIELVLGDFLEAAKSLQKSLELCVESGMPFFDSMIRWRLWSAARFILNSKDVEAILESARVYVNFDEFSSSEIDFIQFHEGMVLFGEGAYALAYEKFQSSCFAFYGIGSRMEHWRCTAYQAEILRLQGELTFETAQPFIQASQPYLDKNVWRVDGDILQGLFAECSKRGWLKITALENQTSFEPTRIPLQISSFGVLQVRAKDQLVRLPLTRAEEMLVYLALHGPSTRAQIIDALWADGADHVDYFKVVVRRLRVTLAEVEGIDFNPLPYENGLYSLNTLLDVQVDASRLVRDDLEPSEVKSLLESYTGSFMPEAEGPWVETWHTKVLEGALAAGMRLVAQLETEDPRGAVAWCEKLLKLEPLYELAHHTRVRLLQQLNDAIGVEQAQREYNRTMRDLEA
jgi:LuxR family transcriptional regulator, maltose regulon positive regulatory protein